MVSIHQFCFLFITNFLTRVCKEPVSTEPEMNRNSNTYKTPQSLLLQTGVTIKLSF